MLLCAPVERLTLGSVAVPPESPAVPRGVAPSKNWTLPEGEEPPLTVAVRLTVEPEHTGLGLIEVMAIVGFAPPVVTLSRPLPVKAGLLCWAPLAPQVPWAMEVEPK